MASLEKAGVFLQWPPRHHLTAPDSKKVLAFTWTPSLGNAWAQTVLGVVFAPGKWSGFSKNPMVEGKVSGLT